MEITVRGEQVPSRGSGAASAREGWPVGVALRWRDYDWLGHLNHISYLDLLLEALDMAGTLSWPCPSRGVSMEFLAPRTVGPGRVLIDRVTHDEASTVGTFTISTKYQAGSQLHARVALRDATQGPGHPVRPHRFAVLPRLRDVLVGPGVDVTFLDWFQESRGDLMQELFLGASGCSVAVVHLEYDRVRAPATADLDFVVSTGISTIGRTSFTVQSVLEAAGSVLASATAVMVKVSLESGHAVELTDADRHLVQAWREGNSPSVRSTDDQEL